MSNTDKLREIARKHFPIDKDVKNNTIYNQIQQSKQDSLLSDLTALISENYVEKAKYDELLRQRDELREALAAMVDQFAYRIKSSEAETLHTMGLSALEDAFDALRIPDPISQENFEAAIKNTDG